MRLLVIEGIPKKDRFREGLVLYEFLSMTIPDKVDFQEIDTFDRKVFLDWGISDALFIDGKQIRTGPPPSYDKIRKKIDKKVKKLNY